MSDPPSSRPPLPLKTLWAIWFSITLCGPLLSLGSIMLMHRDIDFIWQGILMLTLLGIIVFSIKIAVAISEHVELVAVALSIGGALVSVGVFFGTCVASM